MQAPAEADMYTRLVWRLPRRAVTYSETNSENVPELFKVFEMRQGIVLKTCLISQNKLYLKIELDQKCSQNSQKITHMG